MLILQIQNSTLEKEIAELLHQQFGDDVEKMFLEFMRVYTSPHNRMKYSAILQWEKDALAYQKEIRDGW